jgi:hypothetical protein
MVGARYTDNMESYFLEKIAVIHVRWGDDASISVDLVGNGQTMSSTLSNENLRGVLAFAEKGGRVTAVSGPLFKQRNAYINSDWVLKKLRMDLVRGMDTPYKARKLFDIFDGLTSCAKVELTPHSLEALVTDTGNPKVTSESALLQLKGTEYGDLSDSQSEGPDHGAGSGRLRMPGTQVLHGKPENTDG